MLNVITLVGRVVEQPVLKNYDGNFTVATINLAVARPYKNMQGEVETDFFNITVWDSIATNSCDYLRKGDLISVKGRVLTKYQEIKIENEAKEVVGKKKIKYLEIVAENIGFIRVTGDKQENYDFVES